MSKELIVLRLGLITAGLTGSQLYSQTHDQPNVILILTDDQGFGDLGFTGNHHVRTPVLDNLARNSIRFTNFYVCPVSAPTRSGLLTGRYFLRTGVRDTYNGGAIMAASEVTLAELLKESGYSTGIFGKWHLGDNYPFRPGDQGFDESVIHLTGGMGQPGDVTTYFRGDSSYFDPVLWLNGKMEKYMGYCSDIFASQALDFIENNSKTPFFCYLAFNAPHTPLQVEDRYYQLYKDIDPSEGYENDPRPFPVMSDKDKEDARKVYAMVTNIDDNVGRILKKLDDLKLSENTIVIFMTDNGPQQRRYLAGMRGLKGSVYRGGVRVPFFIRYPALGISDRNIDVTAANIDVFPTIADICGSKLPDNVKYDGISLLPFIKDKNKKPPVRSLFFSWTRRNPELYNNVAVLKGGYKLVGQTDYNSPIEKFELYNIDSDPFEQHNIIQGNSKIASALKNDLDSIFCDLIGSYNMINKPLIEIGNEHENPVILNRNDAGGDKGIWEQENIYGKWDLKINEGKYDIKFRFIKPVPGDGRMVVETQTVTYQVRNTQDDFAEFTMRDVEFPAMESEFIPYYETGSKRILPLWVEISRVD